MQRPFFKSSLSEIKEYYSKNRADPVAVEAIIFELSFRKTGGAKAFLASIESGPKGKIVPPIEPPKEPISVAAPKPQEMPKVKVNSTIASSRLTAEQGQAIDLFSSKDSLKVNAFAGTGKTTTLVEMAKTTKRTGLYLAFNKAIAEEAKTKFPSFVKCSTNHSLAYRSVVGLYKSSPKNKMTEMLNGNAAAKVLELCHRSYNEFALNEKQQGSLVLSVVKKFLYSDSPVIGPDHFPRYGKLLTLNKEERRDLEDYCISKANELWSAMMSSNSDVPLGHDGYVKVWALSNPELPVDYIMLDEAQDSNPAILGVLKMQKAQIIYVGDRHQQIYEWRGAVNAMEKIPSKHESHLTTSFRFGSSIADEANKVLRRLGESKPMQGNPTVFSKLGCSDPQTIIARTNSTLIESLMELVEQGRKPAIVGGTGELLRLLKGVEMLQGNQPSDVPEFFGFSNWQEVVQFSQSEDGESLRMLVSMVSQYGLSKLFGFLRAAVDKEELADVILTTTHKAKGREWDRVELLDDFVMQRKDKEGKPHPIDPEEFRILYVAMTRGKKEVQLPNTVVNFLGCSQPERQIVTKTKPAAKKVASSRASTFNPHMTKDNKANVNNIQNPSSNNERSILGKIGGFLGRLMG